MQSLLASFLYQKGRITETENMRAKELSVIDRIAKYQRIMPIKG